MYVLFWDFIDGSMCLYYVFKIIRRDVKYWNRSQHHTAITINCIELLCIMISHHPGLLQWAMGLYIMWRRLREAPVRRHTSLKRLVTCPTVLRRHIHRRPPPALKSLCHQVGRCDMTFMDDGKTQHYCLETGKFLYSCIQTNLKYVV